MLFFASTSGLRALHVVNIVAWELEPRTPRRMVAGSFAFTLTILALAGIHLVANPLYGGGFATDLLATIGLTAADTAVAYAALSRLPHGTAGRWAYLPGALLFGVGIEGLRLVTAVYLVGKLVADQRPVRLVGPGGGDPRVALPDRPVGGHRLHVERLDRVRTVAGRTRR